MLVIGGHDYAEGQLGETKDIFTNGLGIFDMTDLRWTSGYDAKAAVYTPSTMVKQYYAKK